MRSRTRPFDTVISGFLSGMLEVDDDDNGLGTEMGVLRGGGDRPSRSAERILGPSSSSSVGEGILLNPSVPSSAQYFKLGYSVVSSFFWPDSLVDLTDLGVDLGMRVRGFGAD